MKPHLHHLTATQTVVKVPSISLRGHYRTVRIRDDTTVCNCPARVPCHHIREAQAYLESVEGLSAVKRALLFQLRTKDDPRLRQRLRAIELAERRALETQLLDNLAGSALALVDSVAALPSPRPLQAYEQLFQST